MPNRYATEIIKRLEKVSAIGVDYFTIFDDWLEMVNAALEALPRHVEAAVKTRTLAEDTDEVKKLWERLRSRYHRPYCWEYFQQAFHILLESADADDWDDTIGDVYMEMNIANKRNGQFFTPYPIARLAAGLNNIEEMLYEHLTAAYLKSPYGVMHQAILGDRAAERIPQFVKEMGQGIVPLVVEHFEVIKVSDCACGSGVMLLAAAETTPRWALDWGLVQFYGQDIDQTCVTMARINMMLHGLNGYSIKLALALTPDELKAVPEPYQKAYQEAQEAVEQGWTERVEEITAEVNSWKQMSMFNQM